MFGMFINTLNEERAVPLPSFLHGSAAAGGPAAPLQVTPRGPPPRRFTRTA